MRKLLPLLFLLLFATSESFAINRLGSPIAASHWDEALPEATHPSFAANLGALQEGRISLGFMQMDLGHLSLTLPGFQIISANTRWEPQDDSLPYSMAPKQKSYFFDSTGHYAQVRYRAYFLVAGGVNVSTLFPGTRNWDLGIGVSLETQQLYDENEDKELWERRDPGVSLEARWKRITFAGAWTQEENRYRLGVVSPMDWQLGFSMFQKPALDKAFGFQLAGEKVFHQSLRVMGGMNQQFVNMKDDEGVYYIQNIEQQLVMGFSIRFRPWRSTVDPKWIQNFVSPFGDVKTFTRYLYDWEVSTQMVVSLKGNGVSTVLTISRWF